MTGRGQMRTLPSLTPMDFDMPSHCLSLSHRKDGKGGASQRGAWLNLCALWFCIFLWGFSLHQEFWPEPCKPAVLQRQGGAGAWSPHHVGPCQVGESVGPQRKHWISYIPHPPSKLLPLLETLVLSAAPKSPYLLGYISSCLPKSWSRVISTWM